MSNPNPLEYQDLIRYDPKWQVLICIKDCNTTIPAKSLKRHLRTIHCMNAKQYKLLIKAISKLTVCQDISDFPRPPNGSPLVQGLKAFDGYQCTFCPNHLTTSEDVAMPHVSQHRRVPGASIIAECKSVSMQTWSQGYKGYWTVIDPNPQQQPLQTSSSSYSSSSSSSAPQANGSAATAPLTWEQRVIQMETERLQNQRNETMEFNARNRVDDTSPWLRHTKWGELFKGKNRHIISATRFLNTEDARVLESSPISVSKLKVLSRAFDRIVYWGRETLQETSWSIRSWLRSYQRNTPRYPPFRRPQTISSEIRYINQWKQFLCYCFRTGLLDAGVRERDHGIRFTTEHLELIREIAGTENSIQLCSC